jgi:hypothetical protein
MKFEIGDYVYLGTKSDNYDSILPETNMIGLVIGHKVGSLYAVVFKERTPPARWQRHWFQLAEDELVRVDPLRLLSDPVDLPMLDEFPPLTGNWLK